MKFIFSLLLFALIAPAQALGVPYELFLYQTLPSGSGFFGRYMAPLAPTPNTSGVFMYDGATTLPQLGYVGAGLSWDGTTLSATAGGTVSSVVAGAGLSGGTITTTGTVSMPSIGTPGSYSGVTTDAQGRVTAGTTLSINDAPGRVLVTSTSATGFQISSGRNARACYEGSFSTTSTIGGAAAVTVFLETADTNSTTPADWTTKARQTYSNTITLAVVLQQVQGNNWSMCRDIPAGKFVRIRSGSVSGTASATINTEQQETLL
jgi:hypothetical protein